MGTRPPLAASNHNQPPQTLNQQNNKDNHYTTPTPNPPPTTPYQAKHCRMGRITSKFAFIPPEPSYGRNDPRFHRIMSLSGHEISIQHTNMGSAGGPEGTGYAGVYAHGNAEDLGINADVVGEMARVTGLELVAFDYTGYGPGRGEIEPSESRAYGDIEAVIAYLNDVVGIPDNRIVLIGRSLGSGPTVQAGVNHPEIAGMALVSPLKSAIRTQPPTTVPGFDIFANISKIPKVSAPLFILHGIDDRVVPYSHGQALADAAPSLYALESVEDAGHNDLMLVLGTTAYFRLFADFVSALPALNTERAAAAADNGGDGGGSSSFFSSSSRRS